MTVCVCVSELIESAMYLFKATGDHTFLQLGRDVVESLETISRVDCGYASVSDTVCVCVYVCVCVCVCAWMSSMSTSCHLTCVSLSRLRTCATTS